MGAMGGLLANVLGNGKKVKQKRYGLFFIIIL
jgi:hypothetical protein